MLTKLHLLDGTYCLDARSYCPDSLLSRYEAPPLNFGQGQITAERQCCTDEAHHAGAGRAALPAHQQ